MARSILGAALGVALSSALFVSSPPALAQPEPVEAPSRSVSVLPSSEELKACLNLAAAAECLDRLYREALRAHSTREALRQIQQLEAADPELRRDCHPIVHAIGRETFRLKGNIHDAFSACDQTCHSGCYHGSVERFLRGDDLYAQAGRHPSQAELREKAASACKPDDVLRVRFQCLHGLGHALLFFSRYQLQSALEACDGLADAWSRESCYGGVFMENVAGNAEKRETSLIDYHYPCNAVAPRYRRECYLMQTSKMAALGAAIAEMFRECARAAEYREPCVQSIGRDLSNEARAGNARAVAETCETAPALDREPCMRGVIYALVDNTWDTRYALPFCSAFSREHDRTKCASDTFAYLETTFGRTADEILNDCLRHANEKSRCVRIGQS
ncbi:MAG TPA: hypothetical protein VNO43_15055 [Candidatus Eisenbacteria bacterium]|nr:hypothetical protein [Candidatus Eisenbacteria bacterium]